MAAVAVTIAHKRTFSFKEQSMVIRRMLLLIICRGGGGEAVCIFMFLYIVFFFNNAVLLSPCQRHLTLYLQGIEFPLFAAFAHWWWGLRISSTEKPKSRWWLTRLRSSPFSWYWILLPFTCLRCSLRKTHSSVLKLIRTRLAADWWHFANFGHQMNSQLFAIFSRCP